jgi:hypothetical protein
MFCYVSSHHQVLIFKNFSEYLQLQVAVRSDPLLKVIIIFYLSYDSTKTSSKAKYTKCHLVRPLSIYSFFSFP